MPEIKSVVDAAQLKKAVNQLVNEDGAEVDFQAIRGRLGAEKDTSAGIFIGEKMKSAFRKVKPEGHAEEVLSYLKSSAKGAA